ncbi:MAG: tRNA (adenosine(37)-N6)-threonylcarbamoyltransferase complex ATPase subunit type 1 TsaE [Acidimicrobiia bacterium]|nr:tRNA (adenosine(37)-N6)-threonylcarbamoyltransferase complex ATPase subunit type 1 TsaE [Acidimicrobiia bacterium]
MTEVTVRTAEHAATQAVGEALAGLIERGDLVLLSGEMGAGKTAFVQGLGRGLGVTGRITSPTFTIAHQYAGAQLTIHHLDVYRLEHLNEALDIGLAEMLDEGSLVVIEWGDAIAPVLPRDYLEVRFAFGASDDDRELVFRPVGGQWLARSRSLDEALSRWSGAC